MKTKLAIALIISTLAIFTLIVVKTSGSSESVVKNSKNPLQNETDLYQVESQDVVSPSSIVLNSTPFDDQEGISNGITAYLQGVNPRLEAQFQAILYLFFLARNAPNYRVDYQAPIKQQRIDILIQVRSYCIVIELKRNGNVIEALTQAQNYAWSLAGSPDYDCQGTCAIAINLNRINAIQFKASYTRRTAWQQYHEIAQDLVQNVRRRFNEVGAFLRTPPIN